MSVDSGAERNAPSEAGTRSGTGPSTEAGGRSADATRFEARPGRPALAAVLLPGLVSVVALLAGGPAAVVGLAGLGLLAAGTRAGRRDAVGGGGLALLAGTLVAGGLGAGPVALLVAAGAALVAWDTAEHAVGLGEQVGARASIGRSVGVHAAGSGLLAALGVCVAYGTFRLAGDGPPVALVLLLGGAVALLARFRG